MRNPWNKNQALPVRFILKKTCPSAEADGHAEYVLDLNDQQLQEDPHPPPEKRLESILNPDPKADVT
jgi:hypothetical protein